MVITFFALSNKRQPKIQTPRQVIPASCPTLCDLNEAANYSDPQAAVDHQVVAAHNR